jgi:hypothetical protein
VGKDVEEAIDTCFIFHTIFIETEEIHEKSVPGRRDVMGPDTPVI